MGYASSSATHQPRPGPSHSGFNPRMLLDRRSRRRQSGSGVKSGKGRVIRNLSVIKYDRDMAGVKQFRPRDVSVIIRGLVEFPPNASEEVIRNNISILIQNSDMDGLDSKKYGPNDFEFVKRTGHSFVIPEFAPDFELDLSALKTLIGQGDVYVRLTVNHKPPLTQNMSTWSDDSDFETSPMYTDSTTHAPASRSPSPTLRLPSSRTTSDATSSSSMPSERRTCFSGVHDDLSCMSSNSHQLPRNSSRTSSPTTPICSINRESCMSISSHQLHRSISRSSLCSNSPNVSSDTHRERNTSNTSLLSQSSSCIRGESAHSSNSHPYQVPRNTSHSCSIALISSTPQREASHTPTTQNSSSFGTATLSRSSLSGVLRSPLRLTPVLSSGPATAASASGVEHSAPTDESDTVVISSQDEDTDDDVFYVPNTPPQELSPLSPKRSRYSEEEEITIGDLYLMFCNLPRSTIDCVVGVAENARKVFNILLNGVKSFPLIAEMSKHLDGSCVTITVSQDSILSDAVAYYKKPSLNMSSPIMVKYRDMPAMDAGGPSRQFYCDILSRMKDNLNILEGPPTRLIPVYSSAVLASDMLKILGRIIVHSLLQEGPGFPFLNPSVFWYLVSDNVDIAVNYVLVSDLQTPVAEMINKVQAHHICMVGFLVWSFRWVGLVEVWAYLAISDCCNQQVLHV